MERRLALRDTTDRYGTITRMLHWGIAALLVWQFGGMLYKTIVGPSPLTKFWVGSHASVGTLLLVLILGRTAWALFQRRARPSYPATPIGVAAKVGHVLLYVLMITVPSLAFLRMIGGTRPIQLFGVPLRGPTAEPVEWVVAPASLLHGTLALVLATVIVGHIAMVVVHRFVWRDDTLARMAGRGGAAPTP